MRVPMRAQIIVPLHKLFSTPSSLPADRLLSIDGEQQYDWGFIRQKVVGLAQAYSEHTAQRWILQSAHPLKFLIRFFALLHAGKEVVIPQNFQDGTIATLALNADANASDLALDLIPSDQSQVPSLRALDPALRHIHIFTSGSSGHPKCISKSLAEFEREIVLLQGLWAEMVEAAHTIATVPHHHIYGLLFRLLWPLATGRCFDCRSDALPELLALASKQQQRLVLVSSPAQLSRLPELMAMTSLPAGLLQIFSSGGPLSAELATRYATVLGSPPIEIYGSTETGGIAWRRQSASDQGWTPFPGMQISTDQDNALLLSSPILNNATPIRLEDAVTLLADQRFELQGRLDRIVKLEEKRLSLPEVERVLHSHPWVLEAAAIIIQRQRPSLAVVVVLDPASQAEWAVKDKRGLVHVLRQHLATLFDPVLLPRYWRFPAALPRNDSGKLSTVNLSKLFKEQASHATAS